MRAVRDVIGIMKKKSSNRVPALLIAHKLRRKMKYKVRHRRKMS